jgi:hypothetical protein
VILNFILEKNMNITREYPTLKLAGSVEINSLSYGLDELPANLVVREDLGIVCPRTLDGAVLHRADLNLYEVRGTITPGGDYLVMFPAGTHYSHGKGMQKNKINQMLSYRSSDRGKTWAGPRAAFSIDYNQHGFIPLIPKGSRRIYCFGTQPQWDKYSTENGKQENAPIGYFWSDDDGHTWDGPELIRPENDPGFSGMSVTRMCETDAGTWLLGAHEGDWSYNPVITNQYILRSENRGKTWKVLPDKRPGGWHLEKFKRMDEGRVLNLGKGLTLFMTRTPEGHLWFSRSFDDGLTWDEFKPSPLVHPDAPPMIELLSDKKTIICMHHNRHHDSDYSGLSGSKEPSMKDRSEIWVSLSADGGLTWSRPRFLFCNALFPDRDNPWFNHNCSYLDIIPDNGVLTLLVPHRWQQVLFLRSPEEELLGLPAL